LAVIPSAGIGEEPERAPAETTPKEGKVGFGGGGFGSQPGFAPNSTSTDDASGFRNPPQLGRVATEDAARWLKEHPDNLGALQNYVGLQSQRILTAEPRSEAKKCIEEFRDLLNSLKPKTVEGQRTVEDAKTILLALERRHGFAPEQQGAKLVVSEFKLPSVVDGEVVPGGSGRYLVLHSKQLRRLHVFDLKQRKIAGSVPAPDDNVLFAASSEHLFVYLGGTGILSRYDLATLTRQMSARLAGTVKALGIGYASQGPLLVVAPVPYQMDYCELFDVQTLRPIPADVFEAPALGRSPDVPAGRFQIGTIINVSAEGRVAVGVANRSSSGLMVAVILDNCVTVNLKQDASGAPRASFSGGVVFSGENAWNLDLEPVWSRDTGFIIPELGDGMFCLALKSPEMLARKHDENGGSNEYYYELTLQVQGDSRPLLRLDLDQLGFGEIRDQDSTAFASTPWSQRFFLNTAYNVLVSVAHDGQRLILADLDTKKILEESGRDYLFVNSQPPIAVRAGEEFRYQIEVQSKHGAVSMKLEEGPEGMELSPAGEVSWRAPRQPENNSEDVMVSIRDASDQENFHAFTLGLISAEKPSLTGEEATQNRPEARSDTPAPAEKFDANEFEGLLCPGDIVRTTREIVKRAETAVVVVDSGNGAGTGFVVGSSGYVLTCAHGLGRGHNLIVGYQESASSERLTPTAARLIRVDRASDLALLKIEAKSPLPTLAVGLGTAVEVGESVIAIGNPGLGYALLDRSVTDGIVSGRRTAGKVRFLQTNAAVNPGNSGGPLMNEKGKVIGMVTLKADLEGVGLAIPVETMAEFLGVENAPRIKKGIVRTWTGASERNPLEAELVNFDGQKVRLKTHDGKEIEGGLLFFSTHDQNLLKRWAASK
jgi:S1-C subfamily serine protease